MTRVHCPVAHSAPRTVRPGNPQFPFPRFPIWPGIGEGIPDSRFVGNREIPRFPIRPGIGNRGPDSNRVEPDSSRPERPTQWQWARLVLRLKSPGPPGATAAGAPGQPGIGASLKASPSDGGPVGRPRDFSLACRRAGPAAAGPGQCRGDPHCSALCTARDTGSPACAHFGAVRRYYPRLGAGPPGGL